MAKNDKTAEIIDEILRFGLGVSAGTAALVLPNVLIGLEKPLDLAFKKLAQRQKEREVRRLLTYMKSRRLIADDYQHGLVITEEGRKRIAKRDYESLAIPTPANWDHKWRIIIYDVPSGKDEARRALVDKVKKLGFKLLLQSTWVHPFPCREEINQVCEHYDISKYVTYIETSHIDHEQQLIKRFGNLIKNC